MIMLWHGSLDGSTILVRTVIKARLHLPHNSPSIIMYGTYVQSAHPMHIRMYVCLVQTSSPFLVCDNTNASCTHELTHVYVREIFCVYINVRQVCSM